jgi:cleavage stimulation factor subunit 3
MDDMDAFLDAQKEYDPTGDSSNLTAEQPAPADDEEEEYDPSAAYSLHPDQDVQSPSEKSAEMADSTTHTPDRATEGNDVKPSQAESAAPTPSKQPRTMGGFVVESEDDEDEVPESKPQAVGSASLNANGVSASPQRSLTHTPNNTLPQTNVPLHSAQDLGHSGVSSSTSAALNDAAPAQSPAVPNGGTPVPDVTKSGVSDVLNAVSARPSATPVTPPVASLPKARLPQDRVGIFEDRIAEDPRGDIDAWLSLIEEHRRRHKYDEARAVYDRFFNVFPSAVSWSQDESSLLLTNIGGAMGRIRQYGIGARRA